MITGYKASEVVGKSFALLTDMVMPGPVSGKALADEVARLRPGGSVVLMSGYVEVATRHGATEPARHLLAKPFRKRELARIVREALDGRTS